jgi:hypothetical protein
MKTCRLIAVAALLALAAGCGKTVPTSPTPMGAISATSIVREALPAGTIIYVVGLFGNPYSVGTTFIVGQDAGPNSYPALNCVQDLPIAFTTSTTG